MIIYHHDNITAFSGAHTWYWVFQHILQSRISVTSVAAPPGEQAYQMII